MVKRQDIKTFVEQVAAQFHPQRVILFGSYAYGKPTADSDVDLLIVMPHEGPPSLKAAEIRNQVRSGFPMDLVVRSPKEIQRRLTMGDFFIREIMERGKPLYEVAPGESATRDMARTAATNAARIREQMRQDMGLPNEP